VDTTFAFAVGAIGFAERLIHGRGVVVLLGHALVDTCRPPATAPVALCSLSRLDDVSLADQVYARPAMHVNAP
jgi:hypothetical protein